MVKGGRGEEEPLVAGEGGGRALNEKRLQEIGLKAGRGRGRGVGKSKIQFKNSRV